MKKPSSKGPSGVATLSNASRRQQSAAPTSQSASHGSPAGRPVMSIARAHGLPGHARPSHVLSKKPVSGVGKRRALGCAEPSP